MKRLLLAIGLLAIGVYVSAQTQVIDYPVKGKRVTESLDIYRALVSDTAVILEGNMYSRPHSWVKIASSSVLKGKNTGKLYRLVRASGIELDKEVYMPETWTQDFALQFEPVNKEDKSVDFDELLTDGSGFKINSICLEEQSPIGKIHCRIEGKTENPAYTRMILIPEGEDLRVNEWISIPVLDGKFSYDFYTDEINMYSIVPWSDYMRGSMFLESFFSETGKVNLTFYSPDKNPLLYSDTPLNKELLQFKQKTDSLFMTPLRVESLRLKDEGKMESPEMKDLQKLFNETTDESKRKELRQQMGQLYENGKAFSVEYEEFQKKSKEAFKEFQAYALSYIQENPSLVGLYLLKEQVQGMRGQETYTETYLKLYQELFTQKYPTSKMTQYMQDWVLAQGIKVGGKFIDFSAPDLNGISHTLSKEIAGKIALIDLWASWCGPCRRTSLSMIPVYEAYKDKGFTIVGVARERAAEDMRGAIEKDKYPWLNLLELNDAGKIWEKYGVGNGGGCTYLVDKEGTILAIHPTAEEVKAILEKYQN